MKVFFNTPALLVIAVAFCLSARAAQSTPHGTKPNVILILADDVGLGDIGCYGGPFPTPHIDALAQGGIRFTDCYSTPLCGPSRCELLTGRYPFRTGLISNRSAEAIQPGHETMIPTVMRRAGYFTASVGKWGQMSHGPGQWGFNEYLVFPGSGCYWRKQTETYRVDGHPKDLPVGEYLPDIMHRFVVNFITRHKERPFFVYYPMSHIHGPVVRTPDSKPGADRNQHYADNILYMDKLVGKLVDELDRLQLRNRTLILFTGDNGTAPPFAEISTVNRKRLNGAKGSMLEGGSRVPLVANWPGVAPAGKVNHHLIDFSDFFATCVEIGGAKPPPGVTLDSHSFAWQIRGGPGTPRHWVFVELNGKSYVRGPRYKLTNAGELFDMSEAPFKEILVARETTDPAAIAARRYLQEVLDHHPAAPTKEIVLRPKAAKPAGKVRKLAEPKRG
jgi:arylsulfatase A